uniref:Serpin domain-containing protein n=2 Tax=Brassica oleracea TaxID=3712 RepID=A0A0D3E4D6_BRAOL|nr:unnamed protein product [Brassica oleracea]
MDNTKMKEKVGKSQVADLSIQETNPKKKQKLSESQVIPRPSLSKFDLVNAIENQNDVAMCLAGKTVVDRSKITAVNGVWIDQSFPVVSSWQDLLVNFFKAEFAQVDFSTKAEIVRKEVLRLGYQQGRDDTNRKFSMYFYLPDKRDGLDNLLKKLTSTHGFLDRHIPRYKDRVGELRIPKFKIEFGFEASKAFDDIEL